MVLDVSKFVGVAPENPYTDALTAAFYYPKDPRKLEVRHHTSSWYDEEIGAYVKGGLESFALDTTRDFTSETGVEEVGMGAGAIMMQRHPEDPTVTAADFKSPPFAIVTARLVWVDWWNNAAIRLGVNQVSIQRQRELREQQQAYERSLWRHLGIPAASTAVDQFPAIK